ncbi:MAG: DsbA family protein [Saprospiraceae bacterium]|nr:DsbA family protein [Saprospiraceae bacterium]
MTTVQKSNLLLCDPETGVCEIPDTSLSASDLKLTADKKPVRIIYFTDPICSSCWGIEPQLRKLKLEFGDIVDITYHMGGLLPDWSYNSGGISKPSDVAHHWDEVSVYYDMPIDGDVWLEDPLSSSFPPSIAFKAAEIQDHKKAVLFLRRIREMVFLEKKNITKWEHLEKAALEVGLDALKLKTDMDGKAKLDFQNDLNLARQLGVRGFPTLFFMDEQGNKLTLYGVKPYEQFERNIRALAVDALKKTYDKTPQSLFNHYPTLTTKEFAVLSDTSTEQAKQVLNQLFDQQRLKKVDTKNGALWIGKTARY